MWRPRNAEKGEVVVWVVCSEEANRAAGLLMSHASRPSQGKISPLDSFFILAFIGLNDWYSDTHWMKVNLFLV